MNQGNWELEQNDIGYGDLFDIFWRRRFWFFGVFCSVLAISIPMAMTKKPLFQSYMQMLVEPNYEGKSKANVEQEFADTSIEVDYATQLKLLTSSEILQRAVDKLNSNYPEELKFQMAQALKDSLTVYQVSGSESATQTKIIQTVYVDETPGETKKVLEAIKEVYLEYNLEQQAIRLQNGLNFINNQIPEARKSLVEAEAALTKLSKEHNLISPEQEAIAIKENIRSIAQEREALKAQRSQTIGNYTALQDNLGLSSDNSVAMSRLSQSSRYQSLLNELQTTELSLATERTRFTDDNPIIQDLINRRDSQRQLLIQEAERILGTIPPNFITELESLQKQGQFVGSDNQSVEQITKSQADLRGIRERELSLAETEAQLRQKLVDFPELIAQYRNLSQETEVKREALQGLLEAKQELEIELSRGGFNWQIIEAPQFGVQIAPNLKKDLLVSFVIASFLGGVAAFTREAMDERISSTKKIEKQISLPILGTTPGLSLSGANPFTANIPFLAQDSTTGVKDVIQWPPFREAIDIIYENVKLFGSNSSLQSLAITSATAGEGKSTFILGLALSVARNKQRVLVIDADLRRPSLHKAFELDNQSGLTNYLAGEINSPPIKQVSFLGESIDVIPSGTIPPDPVKLLSSSKLDILINQQKNNYDLILIDTPPAIGMVDAIKIASICDSTVLMMRLERVKTDELIEATGLLSKLNVLGIVANDSKDVAQTYDSRPKYLLPERV